MLEDALDPDEVVAVEEVVDRSAEGVVAVEHLVVEEVVVVPLAVVAAVLGGVSVVGGEGAEEGSKLVQREKVINVFNSSMLNCFPSLDRTLIRISTA